MLNLTVAFMGFITVQGQSFTVQGMHYLFAVCDFSLLHLILFR